MRYGSNPSSQGYKYGHVGILVRVNGKMMLASNFEGHTRLRRLSTEMAGGYTLWRKGQQGMS
jgi:hypothetical protein